jgi:hypothetical protein
MALLSFDIEIADVFELAPGEDLDAYAPFHISVAATQVAGGEERLWLSREDDGRPALHMTRDTARAMLGYLDDAQRQGHRLVAWNGLSFDLRWIGHVAEDMATARRVARGLYDPMYQFYKLKGFPVGLSKVGAGMGVTLTKLMDGADAPVRWRNGEHQAVCDYVLGDVRMTTAIVEAIEARGEIAWVTSKGTTSRVAIRELRPVESCLKDPVPDQSWMGTPLPDEKFTGWLDATD